MDEGEPSWTAVAMAAQRALETCEPESRRLVADPWAHRFLTGRLHVVYALRRLPVIGPLALRLYDAVAGPGPRASAVARTLEIDDVIEAEAGHGIERLVLLGAGYDMRAHRLGCLQGVEVFEVDRAETQGRKHSLVEDVPSTGRVHHLACDFERDDLGEVLTGAGVAGTGTIVVWEGVTNYLTADAVASTLHTLARVLTSGSTLVFTYVDRRALGADGAREFPDAARWLRAVASAGEPWTFGLAPGDVREYLSDHGFELASDRSTYEIGLEHFGARRRREKGSRLYRVVVCTRSDDAKDQR